MSPIRYGVGKVELANAFAETHGIDLDAELLLLDSITDLPMLERVGFPRVVNPDPRLLRIARRRGWPVLDWRHDEPPRRRSRSRSSLTAFVVATCLAGCGARTLLDGTAARADASPRDAGSSCLECLGAACPLGCDSQPDKQEAVGAAADGGIGPCAQYSRVLPELAGRGRIELQEARGSGGHLPGEHARPACMSPKPTSGATA